MKKLFCAMLCLGLCFSLTGCSDGEMSDKSSDNTEEKEDKKDKVYTIDDTITYSEDDVELYTFKINSVKATKERNEFDDSNPEQVIVIDYTYENVGSDEDVFISGALNFTVIDEDGNVCDTYPLGNKYSKETPKGAKCTAEEYYGLQKKSSKIKLRFEELFGDSEATFELEIK